MNVRLQRAVVHGGIPGTGALVFQIETIPTGQITSVATGFCYGIKISAHSLLCSYVFDEERVKLIVFPEVWLLLPMATGFIFGFIMQAKNTVGIVIFRDARVNAYISANRSPLLMIIMNIIMVSNLHGE